MSIFMDKLLLLVHTLLSLSKDSPDSLFRAKCEKHINDEWLQRPTILQCCMETSVIINNKAVPSISLSDNGSILSFASAQFIKTHRLPIMGVWRGSLQFLSDVKNVSH